MSIFCWKSLESFSSISHRQESRCFLESLFAPTPPVRWALSRESSSALCEPQFSWVHFLEREHYLDLGVLKLAPLACRCINSSATLLKEGCAELSNNWPKSRICGLPALTFGKILFAPQQPRQKPYKSEPPSANTARRLACPEACSL